MRITIFENLAAKTKEDRDVTLEQLYDLVFSQHGSIKEKLPLVKLGIFGNVPTKDDCLRHNANVLSISGVETDYDAGVISYDAALASLREAGALALAYTSPSYTPEFPKWRVLFPLSAEVAPSVRTSLADRANAILGRNLARETWTVSQAYYYGRVDATAEHFRIDLLLGTPIDLLTNIDGEPFDSGKPSGRRAPRPSPEGGGRVEAIEDLPAKLKRAIKGGDSEAFGFGGDRSRLVFFAAGALVRRGWSDERIAGTLLDAANGISKHIQEQSDPAGYALRQAQRARERTDLDWEYTENGALSKESQRNIRRALDEAGYRFHYDEFVGKGYVNGSGPLRLLEDKTIRTIRLAVDEEHKMLPHKDFFQDVVEDYALRNPVHPVRDYLVRVEPTWDGIPRLGAADYEDPRYCLPNGVPLRPNLPSDPTPTVGWLTRYGGAPDTPYVRAVGRLILVAAVRRVRQPGCKFDEMLVLVDSTQGTEKSTALRTLSPDPTWFTDSLALNANDREVIEATAGHWLVEASDLNGITRRTVEHLKAMLSRQVDTARLAYARMPIHVPRQWVPFGTTNELQFLRDVSNRRFWPVNVTQWDVAGLAADRDQIWAEAARAETAGEPIRLDRSLWALAGVAQEDARREEPWVSVLEQALYKFKEGKIATHDVWEIVGRPVDRRTQDDNARLGSAMRELGWSRKHANVYGRFAWVYAKGENQQKQIYIIPGYEGSQPRATYDPPSFGQDATTFEDDDPRFEEFADRSSGTLSDPPF